MSARDFIRSALVVLAVISFAAPANAQCRDSRGEPAPCDLTPAVADVEIAIAPPVVVTAPAVAPTPVVEPDSAPNQTSSELGAGMYFDFALTLEGVDTRQLRFSPESPGTVAAIAAPGVAVGVGSDLDSFLGGFTLTFGARPIEWLRLPQLSVSMAFGDLEGATATLAGAAQPLTASFHDMFVLRAELAGGFDADLGVVRLFALAHVALAGYFVTANVQHETLGSLGSDLFAEDTWEAGWTVGMDIMFDENVGYTLGYRHVHTGVESNFTFFGVHADFE